MQEQWRSIDGYPDYEVSDQGRVRRVTARTCAKAGAILSTKGLRAGYPSVDLCRPGEGKRTFHLHRLVAAAFLGRCAEGMQVNHINGDREDARLVNLEYVTVTENHLHAYRTGLADASHERNGQAKLTTEIAERIRTIARQPDRPSYAAIAREFGVTEGAVRAVVHGKTWQPRQKTLPLHKDAA